MTTDNPVTRSIITPESPSRVNSNKISGFVIQVKNFKLIGSYLLMNNKANIPEAVAKDKSAELIVIKFSKSSFKNLEIIFSPIAVSKGKNTTTKSRSSTF